MNDAPVGPPLPIVATPPEVPEPPPAAPPKALVLLILLGIMFSASAAVASVISAQRALVGAATRDDMETNRRYLESICENANVLVGAYASASPQPCHFEE